MYFPPSSFASTHRLSSTPEVFARDAAKEPDRQEWEDAPDEAADVAEVGGVVNAGEYAEVYNPSSQADSFPSALVQQSSLFTSVSHVARQGIENQSFPKIADDSLSPRGTETRGRKFSATSSSKSILPEGSKLRPQIISPITSAKRVEGPSSVTPVHIPSVKFYAHDLDGAVVKTSNDPGSAVQPQGVPQKKDVTFIGPNGLTREVYEAFLAAVANFSEDDVDLYTQCTFKELMQARKESGLPYFIAVVYADSSKGGLPSIVDGISFLRDYFRWGRVCHPTTRRPITSFLIFKSSRGNPFKLFCSGNNIRECRDHFAKWINACDPDLKPILRGRERFYMACYYQDLAERALRDIDALAKRRPLTNLEIFKQMEKREHFLDKHQYWLEKSADDEYLIAYVNLAYHYLTCFEDNSDAVKMALMYLRKAVAKVDYISPKTEKILLACLEVFLDYPELCSEDIDRVKILLDINTRSSAAERTEQPSSGCFSDHQ
ncbi:hypothetical protein [Estrella lausannensis]|uniref:Uncharacterized protein n=1 Tax=Estrella lausannensis TaxID=483423 RepID=A0A0H5DR02_9BACT|nr:hypothetical protein [Estrella lausannensis]CRX39086.1 hypothetical protein ELAC_1759 [Estrella lausannensis]